VRRAGQFAEQLPLLDQIPGINRRRDRLVSAAHLTVLDADDAASANHPGESDDSVGNRPDRVTGIGGQVDPPMSRQPPTLGRVEETHDRTGHRWRPDRLCGRPIG
jgi:hypothetical protein